MPEGAAGSARVHTGAPASPPLNARLQLRRLASLGCPSAVTATTLPVPGECLRPVSMRVHAGAYALRGCAAVLERHNKAHQVHRFATSRLLYHQRRPVAGIWRGWTAARRTCGRGCVHPHY